MLRTSDRHHAASRDSLSEVKNVSEDRELTLRELAALVKGFQALMNERDRRYEDRFTSLTEGQKTALAALEKQTTLAFDASEKAIVKSEGAQAQYNVRSNEFRAALDDANKHMMPRPESEQLHRAAQETITRLRDESQKGIEQARTEARVAGEALSKEIANLRESRSQLIGAHDQQTVGRMSNQWAISVGIALAGTILGLAYFLTNVVFKLIPVLTK
jgi:hypothetical protein